MKERDTPESRRTLAAMAFAASMTAPEPYVGRDLGVPAGKRSRHSDPKKRAKRKAQRRARRATRIYSKR